eukprot:COSAG01_NODE_26707_length_705_cov_1.359736_1_plen_101_part_00
MSYTSESPLCASHEGINWRPGPTSPGSSSRKGCPSRGAVPRRRMEWLQDPVYQVLALCVVALGAFFYVQSQTRAIRQQAQNFPGMPPGPGKDEPGEMKRD